MSIHDQATAALLSQLLLAADGAVLGIGLAYVAIRSIMKFTANSSALRKIEQAPSVRVSDLRPLLDSPSDNDNNSNSDKHPHVEKLVIVRGAVEAKSAVKGNWKGLRSGNVLVSNESSDRGVILQRTQTCIYNEGRGLFGWTTDLRSLILRSRREQQSSSIRMVPFILVETGKRPQSDYVYVNMEGSQHPLPLTTIYHHLQPINASPYTFLQAIFGHEYPVGMLDEEKILPLGKKITAVGICSLRNGAFELKSCKDLPYFLSDMTKEQMIVDLVFKSKVLLWSGVALGSVAIGLLGFAAVRNWRKWKARRLQRQAQQQQRMSTGDETTSHGAGEEENEDVPAGQLCVICLMRRKRSAFIPCGHLACCQRCGLAIQRELSPKCPLCRQTIRSVLRIFDS